MPKAQARILDSGICCTPVQECRTDEQRPVDGETERYEYSTDSMKIWFAGRSAAFGGAFIKQLFLSGHPYTPSRNYSASSARVFASGFCIAASFPLRDSASRISSGMDRLLVESNFLFSSASRRCLQLGIRAHTLVLGKASLCHG
jgi:hypothetical protein